MSSLLTPSVLLPWIVYFASSCYLLGALLELRAFRNFPRFTVYSIFMVVQTSGLFGASHSAFWYYWLYFWTGLLGSVMRISVLYEVLLAVLGAILPTGTKRLFSSLFWIVGCGFAIAILPTHKMHYAEFIDVELRILAVVSGVGFGFVFLFQKYFLVPSRRITRAIALGFLLGSVSDLAYGLLPFYPSALSSLAWVVVIYIWTGSLGDLRPVPKTEQDLDGIKKTVRSITLAAERCRAS